MGFPHLFKIVHKQPVSDRAHKQNPAYIDEQRCLIGLLLNQPLGQAQRELNDLLTLVEKNITMNRA